MNRMTAKNCCKIQTGITLIELMVTIIIIGILSAVAVGNYSNYVLKTHRVAAQTALFEVLSEQQNHFARNITYVTDLSELGYTLSGGNLVVDEHYAITAEKCSAPLSTELTICVQLTATAIGNQVSDGNLGANSAGGITPPEKW